MDCYGKVFKETKRAWKAGARLIANKGGTRSGKTYSVISLFVYIAMVSCNARDIDVVSESLPHLKRGAMQDIEDILDHEGLVEGVDYTNNRSDRIYSFPKGTKIRFFSADDWGKVKGSRRDVLFINEANRIEYEVFRQLSVRTTETIIIDWNPDAQFWYELRGLQNREDTVEIHSTYLDNLDHLTEMQVAEIESNKGDENWWNVYGLGLTGHAEGIVYKNWDVVQTIPQYARLVGHGLDFGYMNDPTAIVSVWYADGELYLDERLYMPGLTNNKIADHLRELDGPIVADSAEMKSIDEIKDHGVKRIEPAIKGKDSIAIGIDILRRYRMHFTEGSLNLISEARNYKYKENRITGEITNEPVDKWNHLLDAARYVALNRLKKSAGHARPVAKLREV